MRCGVRALLGDKLMLLGLKDEPHCLAIFGCVTVSHWAASKPVLAWGMSLDDWAIRLSDYGVGGCVEKVGRASRFGGT